MNKAKFIQNIQMARFRKITHGVAFWLIAGSWEEYIFKKLSYALLEHRMNNLTGMPRFMKRVLSVTC